MLLSDVLKEFLFEIKIRNYSPKTQKGYKNNNALFHTWIKNEYEIIELEEVTHLHIKMYITYLQQKGRKPTYVNGILKNIRSFFEYCLGEGYVIKNPWKQVKWAKEGVERVLKAAGEGVREEIRVSPHTLLHYFTQAKLRNGMDMYSLSRLLGHETVSTINRYLQGLQGERFVEMSIKTSP